LTTTVDGSFEYEVTDAPVQPVEQAIVVLIVFATEAAAFGAPSRRT